MIKFKEKEKSYKIVVDKNLSIKDYFKLVEIMEELKQLAVKNDINKNITVTGDSHERQQNETRVSSKK